MVLAEYQVIFWARQWRQATLSNLEIGEVLAEYQVIFWARQRGQATLPNLEIGTGAC
jgi:hypothetical protein